MFAKVSTEFTVSIFAGAITLCPIILYHPPLTTVSIILQESFPFLTKRLAFPKIPKDPDELKELADGSKFSRTHQNAPHGCIGAIYGIAIRLELPPIANFTRDQYTQKKTPRMTLRNVGDAQYSVRCYSAHFAGAIHESFSLPCRTLAKFYYSIFCRGHFVLWSKKHRLAQISY